MTYKIPLTLTALALIFGGSLPLDTASAQSIPDNELVIENFIGTINWSNDAGKIRVIDQDNMKDVNLYEGDSFLIDGGISDPDGNKCEGYYGNFDLNIFNKKRQGRFGGYEDLEDYPVISLTLPEDTNLVLKNAIVFSEGEPNIAAADLTLENCGKINLGNVSEALNLKSKGAADLSFLNAGSLTSDVAGSSDIKGESVGPLYARGRGSGDIEIETAASLDVEISGSGDLQVQSVIGDALIKSSGSGDSDLGDLSGELDYRGAGSGDLSIDEIGLDGAKSAKLKSAGSGDIDIDNGLISFLTLNVSGSSHADIDATVEDVVATASGSSDIYINTVTGSVEKRSSGSSGIDIGRLK